jgi:hypothetical protein
MIAELVNVNDDDQIGQRRTEHSEIRLQHLHWTCRVSVAVLIDSIVKQNKTKRLNTLAHKCYHVPVS